MALHLPQRLRSLRLRGLNQAFVLLTNLVLKVFLNVNLPLHPKFYDEANHLNRDFFSTMNFSTAQILPMEQKPPRDFWNICGCHPLC
jgi:hypothetical protein